MMVKQGLLSNILEQVGAACRTISCDDDFLAMLSASLNEVAVNFPVRLDNEDIEVFSGFRVQHNNMMGPFLGGLRYHPMLNLADIKGLAIWNSLQNALLNLPLGGSMGGIMVNTQNYSVKEIERITRRFIFALGSNIGPDYDIISPDVNTNSQIMAWAMDTYTSTVAPARRSDCSHVVCGKPLGMNGLPGHSTASGKGLAWILQEWAKENDFDLKGSTYFLQGFGKVGQACALELAKLGMILLAVEDSSGPIYCSDGIEPTALVEYVSLNRKIHGYPKANPVSHQEFMELTADIFIPSALQNQINSLTAPRLNVNLVVEGASSPTDQEGDEILRKRGISVIPDILGNAGGAVASYLEWLQNKRSENWDKEEIEQNIRRYLLDAYGRINARARKYSLDFRSAAIVTGVERLQQVAKGRGLYP